jgi:hypothetical protein
VTAVKVVRFLAGAPSPAGALRECWSRALAQAGADGPPGRPHRVAVCEPLALPDFPAPAFAAVDLQWFPDTEAAGANEAWLRAVAPDLLVGGPGTIRLVVEEVVPRGRAYLDARWADGGARYKMMSFGRRNPALTAEEFSARWRSHAGRLGAAAIPDDVRGLAYVQDHPVAPDGCDRPLDAVNEVYFEGLDDLRRRRDWFAARQGVTDDLMSPTEAWSLFVREFPVSPSGRDRPPGGRP